MLWGNCIVVLLFDLALAPWAFTKVLTHLLALAFAVDSNCGVPAPAQFASNLEHDLSITTKTLQDLGQVLSLGKTILIPFLHLEYLGLLLDRSRSFSPKRNSRSCSYSSFASCPCEWGPFGFEGGY